MGDFKRAFKIRESVDGQVDAGAAMDAIGDLRDVVEEMDGMIPSELAREVYNWFKANLKTIMQALSIEAGPAEAKEPKLGSGERFKKLTNKLAKEGGPGSGPKPGDGAGAKKAKPSKGPELGSIDDVGPIGDEEPTDEPSPSSGAGIPSDVMKKLQAIIQDLESIVPDEDPDGDEPIGDDMDVEEEGVEDPAALAATIGRKKYGKERFQKMAAAGRKRR